MIILFALIAILLMCYLEPDTDRALEKYRKDSSKLNK